MAVWHLEDWCECFKAICFTHFDTFLLAGWCLSCRFPYSVSVSWGRDKHGCFTHVCYRISQTQRGRTTASESVVGCFVSVGRRSALLIAYRSAGSEPVSSRRGYHFSIQLSHLWGALFGLSGLYVLGHSQVDEFILSLGLHHARALLSHHLYVFGDVYVAVQTCSETRTTVRKTVRQNK